MKTSQRSWRLFAVLAAGALCAAIAASPLPIAEPQPTPVMEVEHRTIWLMASDEGSSAVIHLPLANAAQGSDLVTLPPRHGGLELEPGAAIYFPTPLFIGRDSTTIVSGWQELRVELRILPRWLPFVGRFAGGDQGPALWDNQSQTFVLCEEPEPNVVELPCERVPVAGLGAGPYIPLAWPEPDGADSPVLFDPSAGSYLFFERRGGSFQVTEILPEARYTGGWPIFGDWNGTGQLELAMVEESGEVQKDRTKRRETWPQALAVPAGDALVWPIRVRRDGIDAIALVEQASGGLIWLRLDQAAGAVAGVAPCYLAGDFSRPVSWLTAPYSTLEPGIEVFFLRTDEEGRLQLVAGQYRSDRPTIIPVKFPDDPSCCGGAPGSDSAVD